MKIAVLTMPLNYNYGGILQAFALKEILQSLGNEVTLINRRSNRNQTLIDIASLIKNSILRRKLRPDLFLNRKTINYIKKNNTDFIENKIQNWTNPIVTNRGMLQLNNMGFDAFIVGSDQCWRPKNTNFLRNYFLDFAKHNKQVKRMSYAISFGVLSWEFTDKETKQCKELLRLFDAISVRENDAINMVSRYFGRDDAKHHLDPTMLLPVENYIKLINSQIPDIPDGDLHCYVLDEKQEITILIEEIEKKLGLKAFQTLPRKRHTKEKINQHNIEDFVYPGPIAWLRGFQKAKFVITDSFHGTVFSILFNKPFIAIGNKKRGLSRFESLLEKFGLQEKLVTDINNYNLQSLITNEIDWSKVNEILQKEKHQALSYLNDNLKSITE